MQQMSSVKLRNRTGGAFHGRPNSREVWNNASFRNR
jgi:hypothetical protein